MSGGGRKLTIVAAVGVAAVLFAMSPSEVPADSTYHDVDVDADGQTDGQACRTPTGVPCDSTIPPGNATPATTTTQPETTTTVPPPSVAPGSGEQAPVTVVVVAAATEAPTTAPVQVTSIVCVGTATVQRGDTWPLLADRLDVWTADLKAANAQAVRNGLMAGATVCVPPGPGNRGQGPPATMQPRTTTTQARTTASAPRSTAPRSTSPTTTAPTTTTRAPQQAPSTTSPKHRPGPGAPTTTVPPCLTC